MILGQFICYFLYFLSIIYIFDILSTYFKNVLINDQNFDNKYLYL